MDSEVNRFTRLKERASRIPFVVLVERLERAFPSAPRVGETTRAVDERVVFRHDPRLVFHSSDVAELRILGDESVEVTTSFLGATGVVSPLATFFTEDVLGGESQDGGAVAAFYDVFHHRLIALFYRALRRRSFVSDFVTTGCDRSTQRALALVGLRRAPSEAPRLPLQMLGRARLFSRRARGKDGLLEALALAFPQLPIRVDEFVSRRVPLAETERLRVGEGTELSKGQRRRLGRDARIGSNLSGQSGLVRLQIGPVDKACFESLLPGTSGYARLRTVVEEVTGGVLEVELEIALSAGEEPRTRLGQGAGASTRLGRGSLVRSPRSDRELRVRVPLTADASAVRPAFLRSE
jgi:type VI secretion system protein ImpH